MFSDIFDGLVSAVIGAIATVFAVYLSHRYASKEARSTPADQPLPKLASRIVGLFSAFEISSAKRFKVEADSAYADARLDLIVGLAWIARDGKFFGRSDLTLNISLPGISAQEVVVNPLPGWTRTFSTAAGAHRLTLTEIGRACTFELRAIAKTLSQRYEDCTQPVDAASCKAQNESAVDHGAPARASD